MKPTAGFTWLKYERREISIPIAIRNRSGENETAQHSSEIEGQPPRTARNASVKTHKRATPNKRLILMVGTRKGAFIYHSDGSRSRWRLDGPHRLGEIVNHMVLDPRDGNTMLMAARAGHLGPTIFRSTDLARTWKEASQPPAFREGGAG